MQIEIDFDVFKALTARRESEFISENDVLRDLLGLPRKARPQAAVAVLAEGMKAVANAGEPPMWVYKSVQFPVGSQLRARYQGRTVMAEIGANGILVDSRLANSPSQAANIVTGTNVNGWTFWEARFPGQTKWTPIQALRPS